MDAAQVRGIVDDLASSEIAPWVDRVAGLEEGLRGEVIRELGRRTVAAVEAQSQPSLPRDGQVIYAMAVRLAGPKLEPKPLEPFIDFACWAAVHQGREGCFIVWRFGTQCFAPMLKLRKDNHAFIHMFVGYVIADFTLGSFRGKASTDGRIREVCVEALQGCPEDLRPHYRAILAAIGDESALDALPELLHSDLAADWLYAHQLIGRMFERQSPYRDRELGDINIGYRRPDQAQKVWGPLNERILVWWAEHRARMGYDRETGLWRAD